MGKAWTWYDEPEYDDFWYDFDGDGKLNEFEKTERNCDILCWFLNGLDDIKEAKKAAAAQKPPEVLVEEFKKQCEQEIEQELEQEYNEECEIVCEFHDGIELDDGFIECADDDEA